MRVTEHSVPSHDGAALFYRAWLPDSSAARPTKAILLFHRGHEHSGRWQQTVEALRLDDDFAVFAWDQRGHGRSDGERGCAESIATITKDADVFARHICAKHGIAMENVVVIAHSVGAVIAAAWVHDFAPRIRAMILATPALRVKLYVPLAVPALRMFQRARPRAIVKSYVKSNMLTHDPAEAHAYDADPQIFRQISVNVLLDLHDTATRLIADAAAITVPTLMLAAGRDWVVTLGAQRRFFQRLGSPIKQFEVLPDFHHAIFHERDRQIVINRMRRFIDDSFARPWHHNGLLEADNGSFSRTEYDLLRGPRALRWRLIQAWMKHGGGQLSEGVRLGWETGFDSGHTLDYVYENRVRGRTPFGRSIDYFYLNSPGWRGIRVRRQHIGRALRECIDRLRRDDTSVRIVDVASGVGRYVLETVRERRSDVDSVLLRDYKQTNLDAATQLATQMQLDNVTVAQANVFDRESLAAISPAPTIVIASGIYELFSENPRILQSLQGVFEAMHDGGYLIYTNMPWHPQAEFIARVLTNREGEPWIMRRRSQAEMDELVRVAGFEKLGQQIDRWGIFTVSVARRNRA